MASVPREPLLACLGIEPGHVTRLVRMFEALRCRGSNDHHLGPRVLGSDGGGETFSTTTTTGRRTWRRRRADLTNATVTAAGRSVVVEAKLTAAPRSSREDIYYRDSSRTSLSELIESSGPTVIRGHMTWELDYALYYNSHVNRVIGT